MRTDTTPELLDSDGCIVHMGASAFGRTADPTRDESLPQEHAAVGSAERIPVEEDRRAFVRTPLEAIENPRDLGQTGRQDRRTRAGRPRPRRVEIHAPRCREVRRLFFVRDRYPQRTFEPQSYSATLNRPSDFGDERINVAAIRRGSGLSGSRKRGCDHPTESTSRNGADVGAGNRKRRCRPIHVVFPSGLFRDRQSSERKPIVRFA